MKNQISVTVAILMIALASCKKETVTHLPDQFKGTAVALGNGHAWSWVETDAQNKPVNVGITFEKTAFSNLPTDGDEQEYILTMPAEKTATPFQMIVLDWNPHGHPPEHVYDKPHFDMHFYMMPESDRLQIPDFETDSTGFVNYPAAAYLPQNYVPIPGGEPEMGTHWVDVTSPELSQTNPQPFTQTFIYGSYNGNVTFYEPMATLAFLTGTKTFERAIPQPVKFSRDGYFPTKMSFTDKGTTFEVTLHDFIYHSKS
ncbi:hypothetical protein FO440_00055 [Mucilaginibacter corticis]|uniref:TTHB210-like domain-containing protein n=1 Tax=Mucilaginibacter corticis TaxID=2597670 RepID=A0A556MRQ9_9SPHI|nr:DUF5602 domain-containing protein [Mucilaginibacter corticis]TSJ42620.1 hypothetical protein FO440_00055 [Mucilaginibacter corticis]